MVGTHPSIHFSKLTSNADVSRAFRGQCQACESLHRPSEVSIRLMPSCLSKLLPVSSFQSPLAPPCSLQLFTRWPALLCVNRRSRQNTSTKTSGWNHAGQQMILFSCDFCKNSHLWSLVLFWCTAGQFPNLDIHLEALWLVSQNSYVFLSILLLSNYFSPTYTCSALFLIKIWNNLNNWQ